MAEFSLDRFKFRWKGDWTTGEPYRRDDIIRVGGKSYVCLIAHTSSALFRTDLLATLPGSNPPQAQPRWVVMTSGKESVRQRRLSGGSLKPNQKVPQGPQTPRLRPYG